MITFFNADHEQPMLYRWQPRQLNNRIPSQQSVFLLGDKQVHPNKACIIVANCKEKILNSLEKHSNITEETLFPDFEGFARQHGHDKTYRFPDYATLANRAFQRSEFDEALLNLNEVINLESKDPWHLYRRAHVKYWLGSNNRNLDYFNEANEDLQRASELVNETDNNGIKGEILRLFALIDEQIRVLKVEIVNRIRTLMIQDYENDSGESHVFIMVYSNG